MTVKELLHEGVARKSLLKLNTSQVFFVYFFTWNVSSVKHIQCCFNKIKHSRNKKIIIYDRSVLFVIRNVQVIGFFNTLTLSAFVFPVFHQIADEWKYYY